MPRGRCSSAWSSPCLIAATISFQAKRTVSSGSLGTYTGNGLGPGFAFAAGFTYCLATSDSPSLAPLAACSTLTPSWSRSVWALKRRGSSSCWSWSSSRPPVSALSGCRAGGEVRVGLRADRDRVDSGDHRRCVHRLRLPDRLGAVEISGISAQAPPSSRRSRRWVLCRLRERRIAGRRGQGRPPQHRAVAAAGGVAARACSTSSPPIRRCCSSTDIDGDNAVLPQLADAAGVSWVNYAVSAAVAVAFIVFVTAVTTAAARSLFTFAHEGALPQVLREGPSDTQDAMGGYRIHRRCLPSSSRRWRRSARRAGWCSRCTAATSPPGAS